jgi:glutaredoxin
MPIVRKLLGALILFADWLTSPAGVSRSPAQQSAVDDQTATLTLYQFKACPFCVKVRRAIKRHSLNIVIKDAKRCDQARNELLTGGGALKVPCLKIDDEIGGVRWMYESGDIITYLEEKIRPAHKSI